MQHKNTDASLINWNSLSQDKSPVSLLLGNGFSINIWDKFCYNSLYEIAKKDDFQNRLDPQSVALFEKLNSRNFEEVLRVVFHARLVDEQLGSGQKMSIDRLYKNIKNALASAVNYSHVPHSMTGISTINSAFRSYKNIFTTNYDLIPYWAIMHNIWNFKDLFWGEDSTFDPRNTSVHGDKCVISYLHGAIHLVELPNGKTKKLITNNLDSLTSLFDLNHPEYFPLFISEGTSEQKISRINKNDYLRFSFEKFTSLKGHLTVFGHALNENSDQHLLDAIENSNLASVNISVWPHQNDNEIILFKSRLQTKIRNKEIKFFDSTTHPLGGQSLNFTNTLSF